MAVLIGNFSVQGPRPMLGGSRCCQARPKLKTLDTTRWNGEDAGKAIITADLINIRESITKIEESEQEDMSILVNNILVFWRHVIFVILPCCGKKYCSQNHHHIFWVGYSQAPLRYQPRRLVPRSKALWVTVKATSIWDFCFALVGVLWLKIYLHTVF